MSFKYYIGSEGFKTKKDVAEMVKGRMNEMQCGVYSIGTREYHFIHNVLKNHSDYDEKVGCGIDSFVVTNNATNGIVKGKTISFLRYDNTVDNFSYNHCCEFRPKGWSNPKQDLNKALRSAIIEQIEDVRHFYENKDVLNCVECGCAFPVDNGRFRGFEIDHVYPFCRIVDDFFEETGHERPTSFQTKPNDYRRYFKDEDARVEQEWKWFHKTTAKYQILCSKCNSVKCDKWEG